jgi:hypothetical protein
MRHAAAVAHPAYGDPPRPVAAALRYAARMVLGLPTALGLLVLGVGLFGAGIGIGALVGFLLFAQAWPLP